MITYSLKRTKKSEWFPYLENGMDRFESPDKSISICRAGLRRYVELPAYANEVSIHFVKRRNNYTFEFEPAGYKTGRLVEYPRLALTVSFEKTLFSLYRQGYRHFYFTVGA